MESLKEIIQEMLLEVKKNYPDKYKQSFEILIKLFTNIVTHPNEPKFRNFKKTNETIKSKVLIIPEIIEILNVLGYGESLENPNEILSFEGETLDNLKDAIEVLNNLLNEAPKGYHVIVYQYDLSQGMVKTMSKNIIGKQVEGIWHTSVCVYGKEYFYGGGIQIGIPKKTPYGYPLKEIDMGYTATSPEVFNSYLMQIKANYLPEKYNVLRHNCNHFTDDALYFLTGKHLPSPILNQHEEIAKTPLGKMVMQMLEQMNNQNNQFLPNMYERNRNYPY